MSKNQLGGFYDKTNLGQSAVFCGAGISYHSGLPIVTNLLSKILNVLGVNSLEAKTLLDSDMPFEYFMETLMNEVSIDTILSIYSKGIPNATHRYIASLVKAEKVKTIMTTNFDQLVEKALLEQDIDFEVYSDENAFGRIDWTTNKTKVIKIHGCVSNKQKLGVTLKAVAKKELSFGKNAIVSDFFSKEQHSNILLMGYSCSDIFDITPLIEQIPPKNGSEIYFVEHCSDEERHEPIEFKQDKNPFIKFYGLRHYINTDTFIKQETEKIEADNYRFVSTTTKWEAEVDKWLLEATQENTAGVVNQLPARLFYNIGQFNIAKKHFELAMMSAHKIGNQIMFYAEMGNLAMTLMALGNYREAKKILKESTVACKDLGNVNGEITQLQALGNACRNLSDFDDAIAAYNEAISLCIREEDLFSLCKSLGNAASAYNHTGRPDIAINYLEEGLPLALSIGDKQSEGSMLCSFGLAYAHKGDKKKAAEYIEKSIACTRMIGDKQSECMALHNLSNIYLGNQNFEECRKFSQLSLDIATSINSTPNIARSQYNIGLTYLNLEKDHDKASEYFLKALENNLKVYDDDSPEHYPIVKGIMASEELSAKLNL